MTLGEKIRVLRNKQGLTLVQLEHLTQIHNGNLSRIEKGKQGITEATLLKICGALQVTLAELCAEPDEQISRQGQPASPMLSYQVFRSFQSLQDLPRGVTILFEQISIRCRPNHAPAWDYASAELLAFQADAIRTITPSKPKDLVSLRVPGNAMAPRLFAGDQILLDTVDTAVPDGGGVFALVFGNEVLVRRLFRRPGGGLVLAADNADYPAIDLRRDEMASVCIIGRVKFRSGTADF